jgi:hypothetical protein
MCWCAPKSVGYTKSGFARFLNPELPEFGTLIWQQGSSNRGGNLLWVFQANTFWGRDFNTAD